MRINKPPAAITSHMVKFNYLTIQTFEELLLAALLYCVSVGDRTLFLPLHARFTRCGKFPLNLLG